MLKEAAKLIGPRMARRARAVGDTLAYDLATNHRSRKSAYRG
jgi:hypothetical protein